MNDKDQKPDASDDLSDVTAEQAAADKKTTKEDRKGPKFVTITVDGAAHSVRKGKYSVSVLKELTDVNPDYQLAAVVGSVFNDLEDGDTVKIKGGEIFVSHPRVGTAS